MITWRKFRSKTDSFLSASLAVSAFEINAETAEYAERSVVINEKNSLANKHDTRWVHGGFRRQPGMHVEVAKEDFKNY